MCFPWQSPDTLGELALAALPVIKQAFVHHPEARGDDLEAVLYRARRSTQADLLEKGGGGMLLGTRRQGLAWRAWRAWRPLSGSLLGAPPRSSSLRLAVMAPRLAAVPSAATRRAVPCHRHRHRHRHESTTDFSSLSLQ